MPNQVRSGIVKEIIYNATTSPNPTYTLNKIIFANNYSAYEKNDGPPGTSAFVTSLEFFYEITHPGRGDKADWIKCITIVSNDLKLEQKDFMIIAQNSMKCTTELLSMKMASHPDMSEDEMKNFITKWSRDIMTTTIENAKDFFKIKDYV